MPQSRSLAWLLLLALLPGCRAMKSLDMVSIPENKDWNLEQLHTPESEHRFTAALLGDVAYIMRRLVTSIGPERGPEAIKREPKKVGDPHRRCLENLLELAAFSPADPGVAALQVEWAARLAVEDPWVLSRERAALMLGEAGLRLGVDPPRGLPEEARPATPEELSAVLARLVRSFREQLGSRRLDEEGARRLAEQCAELRALTLDLSGARRALRATRMLLASRRTHPAMGPLEALAEDLQRRLIDLGLAAALADREPRVRAAGLTASVQAVGRSMLLLLPERLERERDPLVLVTALRLVAEHGLPPPEDEQHAGVRRQWMGLLTAFAFDEREGWVQVNAMQALARVSDGALTSLREEDWIRWWLNQPGAAVGG